MIKRTSKYISLILLGALIIGVLYLSTTFSGLKFVTNILSDVLPGHLQLELRSGALTRTIVINSLQFDNKDVHVSGTNIQVKLQLLSLILNNLDINKLEADTLTVHVKEKNTHSNAAPEFDMPLKIAIDSTAIKHFRYQEGQKKYVVNNLNFSGGVRSNVVNIIALKANYQSSHYALHGTLSLKPVMLDMTLQQQKMQQTTLQASLKAEGTWQHLTWQAFIKTPVKLKTNGVVNNLLTKPSWTLLGSSKHLAFDENRVAYSASFKGAGDSQQLQITGEAHANDPKTNTDINFKVLSIDLPKGQFNTSLNWHNVFWPQRKRHLFSSPTGNINIVGSMNSFTLKGDLTILGNNIPNTAFSFSGQGNKSGLTIPKISINTLKGTITGNSNISWQHQLHYQLELQAQHLQPDTKWVNFPGDISFGLKATSQQKTTNLTISSIEGELRNEDVHGFANLQLNNYHIKNAALNLKSNNAYIKANVTANKNQHITLQWDINLPKLETLTPFAQGSLISKATYIDNHTYFTLQGTLSADGFNWQNYNVGNLTSQFNFNSNANKSSFITLNAKEIDINKYYIKSFSFNTQGKNPKHQIDFLIDTHDNVLDTRLLASYNASQASWYFKVDKMNLTSSIAGNWQLKNAYQVVYSPTLITINQFNWQSNQQKININHFNLRNNTLHSADVALHKILLRSFNPLLPDAIRMHGSLNLKANYKLNRNDANGKIKLSLDRARFSYPLHEKTQNLSINKAEIAGSITDNQVKSQLNVTLKDNGFIKLGVNVDNYDPNNIFDKQQNYHANLSSKLNSLDIIKPFVSNLEKLSGQFAANITWNGTLKQPNIKGSASLNNTSVQEDQQGLDISNINFHGTGVGDQVNYLLTADSGKGNVKASGSTFLNENYKTLLTLTGKQFEVDRSPHFHIIVSPKLKIAIRNDALHITGDLVVPFASIDLISYADVQTLSSDVQIVQVTGGGNQNTLLDKLFANINLILGDNVSLKTKFLTAQLAGKIQLVDNPKTQTNANGELTITKGTVSAFGQSLMITNGKLLYAGGPTTNPGLNIKAFKQIKTFVNPAGSSLSATSLSSGGNSSSGSAQAINAPLQQKNINVGVSVTNSLSNPHIMLYSDQPDLSQADILSYLILGYPMNSATNQQGEALIQAANALSASNNDMSGLISNIKNTLNLNEIGLQSNNYLNPSNNSVEQNTSLVLGKMLSPKLFVHYSIGLIIPVNTLSATYSFNQNWSLQTETNSLGNGVDLIYSWQHN